MKISLLIFLFSFSVFADSPLQPIRLDHPRDTMKSYMDAMNDYKKGLTTGDPSLTQRINDAIRCFDLSGFPPITRFKEGKKAAILLKEVLDRVILIDFQRIPDSSLQKKWRLKDTEITIARVGSGPRIEDYLFTTDTVLRAKEFYNKVKGLPYLEGTTQGAGFTQGWQESLPEGIKKRVLGIEKWKWLGIFLSLILGLVVKIICEFLVIFFKKFIQPREESIRHQVILALEKPIGLLGATTLWFLCIYHLQLEGLTQSALLFCVQFAFSLSFVWSAYRLTDVCTELFQRMAEKTESDLDDHLAPLISKSLRLFVIIIGGLVTMQNLGFNVMSLLAGLGIGGLAFALAAKDTAANLFGSIMIFMDRPFKVGDWIITNNTEGTVEEVGFRSTRIRTFYNSVISIPNSALANANIDNMGQRHYRRIRTNLALTYNTTPEKMEAFIAGIKKVIQANPYTRKDNYHVVFNSYGDSSLNVLLYVFLEVPNWSVELVEKQNIFLEIMKLTEKVGVEFAFPTQTLHVESLPELSELPGKNI